MEPIAILVDNSVLGNAVTHETLWVTTSVCKVGSNEVPAGYLARVPVHHAKSKSALYQQVVFLTGIARLARQGFIELRTSRELRDEAFRQPIGRYKGYGWFDYNLFHGLKITSVDGFTIPIMGPANLERRSAQDQQRRRIEASRDPLYLALVEMLGPKSSQDAWHIRTAEAHGLFCFLTMDLKLCRAISNNANREPVKSLRTRVMSPEDFGNHFGILPVPPHIFSYDNATSFVRSDLSMPGARRRPRSMYRSG